MGTANTFHYMRFLNKATLPSPLVGSGNMVKPPISKNRDPFYTVTWELQTPFVK